MPGLDSCSGRVVPRTASSKPRVISAEASWPLTGPAADARRRAEPLSVEVPQNRSENRSPSPPPLREPNMSDMSKVVPPSYGVPPRVVATGPEPAEAAAEQRAGLVVLLALGRVREHVVGLGHLLEPRLRLGVARVLVRVQIARELAVRALDARLVGVLGDAQRRVVVLLHVILRAHGVTSSPFAERSPSDPLAARGPPAAPHRSSLRSRRRAFAQALIASGRFLSGAVRSLRGRRRGRRPRPSRHAATGRCACSRDAARSCTSAR